VAPRDPVRGRGIDPHGHTVLVALTLNDVPIDVLEDRLGPTRGGLDRTLHDAYSKLRARLARDGLALGSAPQGGRA
jgi:RNA polymerase sigma-70 factor, ECF subfamily